MPTSFLAAAGFLIKVWDVCLFRVDKHGPTKKVFMRKQMKCTAGLANKIRGWCEFSVVTAETCKKPRLRSEYGAMLPGEDANHHFLQINCSLAGDVCKVPQLWARGKMQPMRLSPGGPPACQSSISNSYRSAQGGKTRVRTP